MEFIIGLLLGIIAHRTYIKIKHELALKKIERAVVEKMAEFKEKVINSRIDEMNGVLYLFNEDNGEFLCQANTFPELEKLASEKFPGKLFNIPPQQMRKYANETN